MDKIPELLRADVAAIESESTREIVSHALLIAKKGLQEGVAAQSSLVNRVRDEVEGKLNQVLSRQGDAW